jgi:choline monooxygenase
MAVNLINTGEFLRSEFTAPLEKLTGLPNVAYNSEGFAEFERDAVLAKTWFCVANQSQLPEGGWLHPVDVFGMPLLVVRDRQSAIRVFHNVCSHRGMKLVEEARRSNGLITCRYHGWCYTSEGSLKATPHINGEGNHQDENFDRELHGLKEIRTHLFAGLIFVNLSGDAADFSTFIKPVTDLWHEFDLDKYGHGGSDSSWEIVLKGNWKFAQENHVDGYHLPFVHPGLNSYSPLRNHYPLVLEGSASGQGSEGQDHAGVIGDDPLPMNTDLSEPWQHGKAEFLSIYPNIMIGVQADHYWTVHLIPISADQTFERMDLYYYGDGATDSKYSALRTANRDRMLEIYEEDRDMVEGMQRGRKSSAFNGGALAPAMDQPAHCFNRIVARAVVDALEG